LSGDRGRLATSGRPLATAHTLPNYGLLYCPPFFCYFFIFLNFFFGVMRKFGDGLGILREWVYNTPIF
jgi:hypothetical protein